VIKASRIPRDVLHSGRITELIAARLLRESTGGPAFDITEAELAEERSSWERRW
jgi:hypothetical protein